MRASVTGRPALCTLATVLGGPLGSRLTNAFGARLTTALGLGVMSSGMALLAHTSAGGSFLTDVMPGTVFVGLGVSAAYVPITTSADNQVGPREEGLASGLYQTTGQIGGALLLALLALTATSASASALRRGEERAEALSAGFSQAYLVGVGLLAAGALTALALLPKTPEHDPGK